jgi:hypothetical protein
VAQARVAQTVVEVLATVAAGGAGEPVAWRPGLNRARPALVSAILMVALTNHYVDA